jgi:glycerol-3-phosphate dehydrogenase
MAPWFRSIAGRPCAAWADESFDVLVIGGGITGAGCALDAATRGLRVALVEAQDFASGTSSKSSKLVHGGLRYLQNGELALVYEALAERQILTRNAPHLVHMLPFLLPIFHDGGFIDRRLARGSAWRCGDTTSPAGSATASCTTGCRSPTRWLASPTLDAPRLAYAYVYYDATADDARLTLAIARTAALHGAAVANYAPAQALTHDRHGRVIGATVEADGATIAVRARVVINACGVWSDRIRAFDRDATTPLIRPAKGIHITLPPRAGRQRHRGRPTGTRRKANSLRRALGRLHLRRYD